MLRFALLRILSVIPTLLLVVVLAFVLIRVAPGGPFRSEVVLDPAIAENIAARYHLDEPLPQQFLRYVDGLLHGDLGPSYSYRGYDVAEIIAGAAPLSMQLGAAALALALVVGGILGITAALKRNTRTDRFVSALAMTGISIPVFVVAPVLLSVQTWGLRSFALWAGLVGYVAFVAAFFVVGVINSLGN